MVSTLGRSSLWGQLFEVAVKRGLLTHLVSTKLIAWMDPNLAAWRTPSSAHIYGAMAEALAETDPNQKARTREMARHLFQMGMGLGQTVMREYLRRLKDDPEDYTLKALWCPLEFPRLQKDFDADTEALIKAFQEAFGDDGHFAAVLGHKGFPARADFLLLLEPKHSERARELLCIEVSLNGLPESADYRQAAAHLAEIERYARYLESRGVFSRVCAEVSNERFDLSPEMKRHLPVFTSRDKPLYKLCQAASYVFTTVRWLRSRKPEAGQLNARAFSITQNGFESLAARFGPTSESESDPRAALMETLGKAYRETEKVPEDGEERLEDHITRTFESIRKALPKAIRSKLARLHEVPVPGMPLSLDFREEISDFRNPMTELLADEAQGEIDSSPELTEFFGQESRQAVNSVLLERHGPDTGVTLRDLHAAAIVAGMRASVPGKMKVLGLEGNPGIGKTTAVVHYLKAAKGGFLFLYVSPRVIINDDVTSKLAREERTDTPSGILCVTTNSKLIATARHQSDIEFAEKGRTGHRVDCAVVADGVDGLKHPDSSVRILSPAEREALESEYTGARLKKRAETERQDRMSDLRSPGVLSVLAKTTRSLLQENPKINQVVLTAAIQGYRRVKSGDDTIQALSGLFRHKVDTSAGRKERSTFAQRIPTIVVMVDELTGDGAGSPFIHSVARWLNQQFIHPFADKPIFRVILVISDASLGNEIVLERYLSSDKRAPDKVLVSQSKGKRPFRLAAFGVRIGGRTHPALHVMTNSYPASKLLVDYRVRLDVVKPGQLPDGRAQTIRHAISDQKGEMLLESACQEIGRALKEGAAQVIFFVQDKAFLRDLETRLKSPQSGGPLLTSQQVAVLDSSVSASRRKALITPPQRDQIKVFLMTSSGARGVSFPKTDWIIARMPRFNIEASLMELAQLIYRGRGGRYCSDEGEERTDGDWKTRHLVMLVQDFLIQDLQLETRQWLRQVSDLLTFLVMLRATIHTRITGDAGLEKQRLALVPVGGIGVDEMLSLMSTQVGSFLRECDVVLRDSMADQDLRGRVVSAQRAAFRVFSKFSLDGMGKQPKERSFVRLADLEGFSACASGENAPLLPDPSKEPNLLLPEHVSCIGPFWLENWEHLDKEERFHIEGWLTGMEEERKNLYGVLHYLKSDSKCPSRLREPAEALYRMLAREKEASAREFSTVKLLESPTTWLAMPVDYARFWQPGPDGRKPDLGGEDAAWLAALGRCLCSHGTVMPIIPRYDDIPYAVVAGEDDPARLDLMFDDRYFAATHELNLLNSLLLATDSVATEPTSRKLAPSSKGPKR